ncbi:hypothetical protein OAG10_05505 [Verrucomicrobia bacterium]|nr:hypothetical protein [Verrucomicrobiota bacterium]
MKRHVMILNCVVFVCFTIAFSGCSNNTAASTPADNSLAHRTLRGSFDLYYTIQTDPSTTAGTGSIPEKVSAMHFYENYIVIEDTESGGRLFPVDMIKEFRWK